MEVHSLIKGSHKNSLMKMMPSLVEFSQEKACSSTAATAVDTAAAALVPASWAAATGAARPLSFRAAGGLATAGWALTPDLSSSGDVLRDSGSEVDPVESALNLLGLSKSLCKSVRQE